MSTPTFCARRSPGSSRELMEAEVAAQIGAGLHEKSAGAHDAPQRLPRARLADARRRDRARHPAPAGRQLLPELPRAAQPLRAGAVAVVQEAYVNGVSTRKVERLVTQLGLAGMSRERRQPPLRRPRRAGALLPRAAAGGRLPLPLAGRQGGARAESPAACATRPWWSPTACTRRAAARSIGIDVGEAETEAFWREFLRSLRARGLAGVQLCVSDAHEGLKARDRQGARLPLAALHGALPARHARPLRQGAAADRRDRHPPDLRRRGRRRGPRAPGRRGRGPGRRRAQGGPPARRGRGRAARLHGLPARALDEAALDQPAGARQPRDRAPQRRGRHLPERRRPDPPRRRACSSSRTTNGSSAAATSRRSRSQAVLARAADADRVGCA